MSFPKFKDLLREIFLTEVSKNDPIPELTRKKSNLAIFLIGPPASGKSTFFHDFIRPRQKHIKRFSTDEISELRRKYDPKFKGKKKGQYIPGSSAFTLNYLEQYIENNNNENFVWDTTGKDPRNLKGIYDLVRGHGYDVIFIHLLIPAKTALQRVKKRNVGAEQPETDIAYTRKSYTGIPKTDVPFKAPSEDEIQLAAKEGEIAGEILNTAGAQKIISVYSNWNPDNYYMVVDVGNKRMFMKYDGGVKIRKNDKYVSV